MTLTTEQSRALVDAVACAQSLNTLVELRQLVRREHGLDVRGGFLEMLIELRQERLERHTKRSSRIA